MINYCFSSVNKWAQLEVLELPVDQEGNNGLR